MVILPLYRYGTGITTLLDGNLEIITVIIRLTYPQIGAETWLQPASLSVRRVPLAGVRLSSHLRKALRFNVTVADSNLPRSRGPRRCQSASRQKKERPTAMTRWNVLRSGWVQRRMRSAFRTCFWSASSHFTHTVPNGTPDFGQSGNSVPDSAPQPRQWGVLLLIPTPYRVMVPIAT